MKTSAWLALPLLVLATLSSCNQKPQLVKKGCVADADCPTGQLCADGECVSMANFRCKATPVDGGMAGATGILQPSPHVVDFGVTGSDAVSKIITLRNIGSCALTVFDATLKGDQGSPFTCDGCGDKVFPLEIFPSGEQSSREKTVTLSFTAPKVGSFSDTLTLLSDDPEFPELKVPVRARFDGVPKLTASPDPVKFGYVAAGADMTRAVQLANHGTGVAAINLIGIRLDPETSATFTLEDSVDHPLPTKDLPVKLVPTGVDPRASYLFTLHYHPRDSSDDQVDVVIDTDSDEVGTIRLTASGTSQTPPALSIDPSTVDFKDVPLGQMKVQTITLQNSGGSPLDLSYTFHDNNCVNPDPTKCSNDYSFTPAALPSVDPGKFFEMQVFVEPTSADLLTGILKITSNDPRRPDSSVNVSARGVSDGTQVVKIEVNYDNGTDGTFDNDLRRLEVSLESPYGFLCNKENSKPLDWGDFGNPSWLALGAKLNPQRVLLVNPKEDGKFRVLLQYSEDCSSLPSQLLASILGISVDALIAYLSGGAVVLDPSKISGAIDSACFSHSSTNATVTVWVNGKTIAEKPASLAKKGDFVYALDLIRDNGVFTAQ